MKILLISLLSFLLLDKVRGSVNRENPGECAQWRARQTVIVNDKDGNERMLICLKRDGVFRWSELDNLSSVGEFFDPGKDCTDIVQRNKAARTGLYWISGYGTGEVRKVWCDVKTDGGGFLLVGYKDAPKSWMQPSSHDMVTPDGNPHWSSLMGNVSMMEFRVQITAKNNSKDVKADWLYSFNSPRRFCDLLINNKGCTPHYPGVGNIRYVKDLRTGKIVTRTFRCSQFGPSYPSNLGWKMMNECLKRPCKEGYAILPGSNRTRYDNYGAFSYSTRSLRSGMNRNSSAFVGCEFGKCCSCFGPKGARGDFCSAGCRGINNGTVTNETDTFFWIRTVVPKFPVWTRCSEYVVRTQTGHMEKYYIDVNTGVAKKGSCTKAGIPNLIDGVVNVADKEAQDKVPLIKGMLSFRKDNGKLYIANGTSWVPLATEEQNQELMKMLNIVEKNTATISLEFRNMTAKFTESEKATAQSVSRISSELRNITAKLKGREKEAQNISRIFSELRNMTANFKEKERAAEQKVSRIFSDIRNITARLNKSEKEAENVSHMYSELKNITKGLKMKEGTTERKISRIYSEFKNITMKLQMNIQELAKKLNGSKNTGGGGEGGGEVTPSKNGSRLHPGMSCKDILRKEPNSKSGLYWIKPLGAHQSAFAVYCNMETRMGGWTLVYSYTFTEYNHFFSKHNAVTPRPNWPVPDANVPVSTTPPLTEVSRGAVDWNLWSSIGSEFMIKSNINDWIICRPMKGSLVLQEDGSLNCTNIKNIATKCQGIAPKRIAWHKYGPFLSARSVFYDFVSTTMHDWPAHDPCGRRRSYEKKGVINPGGAIFLR